MKFGIFYELQLPRPWAPGDEHRLYQNALEQIEIADRLGYDHAWQVEHHFLEEYSHSPVARILPRRGQPAHQADPAGPRHHAAHHQPSGAGRREDRHARPAVERPLRVRHGRERLDHRARAVRRRDGEQARDLRGSRPRHHADVQGRPERASGQVLQHAAAPGRAEAAAEAASAAVGRLLAARDAGQVRRMGHGRARLPVRLGRRRARLGARLLQRLREAAEEARRLRQQPEHRAGLVLHVRADRRGGARPRRRRHLLPVRAALLCGGARPPPSARRHRQHVGRVPEVEAGQPGRAPGGAARRPDRLAGDDPAQAAPLPVVQHRPGRAAQPGRPQHARAHLRIARAVRQGSDARVPGGASPAAASGSSRC